MSVVVSSRQCVCRSNAFIFTEFAVYFVTSARGRRHTIRNSKVKVSAARPTGCATASLGEASQLNTLRRQGKTPPPLLLPTYVHSAPARGSPGKKEQASKHDTLRRQGKTPPPLLLPTHVHSAPARGSPGKKEQASKQALPATEACSLSLSWQEQASKQAPPARSGKGSATSPSSDACSLFPAAASPGRSEQEPPATSAKDSSTSPSSSSEACSLFPAAASPGSQEQASTACYVIERLFHLSFFRRMFALTCYSPSWQDLGASKQLRNLFFFRRVLALTGCSLSWEPGANQHGLLREGKTPPPLLLPTHVHCTC